MKTKPTATEELTETVEIVEEVDEEVRRPGGTGRIRGKLNELWALVGAVAAARERDRRGGGGGGDCGGEGHDAEGVGGQCGNAATARGAGPVFPKGS